MGNINDWAYSVAVGQRRMEKPWFTEGALQWPKTWTDENIMAWTLWCVRQYWLRNKYLFGKRLGEDSNHLLPTDLSVGETRWGV